MGAQQALLGGALGPFTATGGSQFTDSGYTYHIMHSDNPSPTANFVVTEGEADLTILVVGGGGGICGDHTGGGGAGGGYGSGSGGFPLAELRLSDSGPPSAEHWHECNGSNSPWWGLAH